MITIITEPEDYSSRALAVYKELGHIYLWPELSENKKSEIKAKADILVVQLGYKIDRTWLDDMPQLKIIATNTTGLNHIDTDYAFKKGLKIISLRGQTGFLKKITSTAELTLGLMLASVRHISSSCSGVKSGKWDRNYFRGNQLSGKTLGIIGYGRLGKIMARYAKVLGMQVVVSDPYVKVKDSKIKAVALNQLFKSSDIVSLHVLLNERNKGFIKFNHFKLMKPSAFFINTARAELIEKDALYKALSQKIIKGAAIDVMDDESADGSHLKNDPLWQYAKSNDNLIITPHIGGATFEAMHITEDYIANLVKNYIKHKKLK